MRIIGKGRKLGDLYMTKETRRLLDDWIDQNNITDYLWPSPMYRDGRSYSIDRIRFIMKRAFKRVGVSGFYPHALRHSFATDLQMNGAQLSEAQKLLRHSSSVVTEVYLHGLESGMDAIYDAIKSGGRVKNSCL